MSIPIMHWFILYGLFSDTINRLDNVKPIAVTMGIHSTQQCGNQWAMS
jgi:hypothetical protein